jgi:phosphoglycolate phosphatase
MIRAVAFDLDGTLIDSRRDIAVATNHALACHGFPELELAEIERYIGDGARTLLARAARLDEQAASVSALVESFLEYYTEHATDFTTLMPGALEALEALSDLPLALCTNKPRRTTLAVLRNLGLETRFEHVSAGGDLSEKKPHPAPILWIAETLRIGPSELVMVGDGAQDILAGRAARAITVGVRGGIQPVERLLAAQPDHVLESLHGLASLVSALRARR